MTFYQFVHGELHKRASKCRETKTQWVYNFPKQVWPYEVRFPKPETRGFKSLYGYAIGDLARMYNTKEPWVGLALLAKAYDQEEANYHAPFENTKTR